MKCTTCSVERETYNFFGWILIFVFLVYTLYVRPRSDETDKFILNHKMIQYLAGPHRFCYPEREAQLSRTAQNL